MFRRSEDERKRRAALRAARKQFREASEAWRAEQRFPSVAYEGMTRKPETQALLDAARAEKWRRLERARLALAAPETGVTQVEKPIPDPPAPSAPRPASASARPGDPVIRISYAIAGLLSAVLVGASIGTRYVPLVCLTALLLARRAERKKLPESNPQIVCPHCQARDWSVCRVRR